MNMEPNLTKLDSPYTQSILSETKAPSYREVTVLEAWACLLMFLAFVVGLIVLCWRERKRK